MLDIHRILCRSSSFAKSAALKEHLLPQIMNEPLDGYTMQLTLEIAGFDIDTLQGTRIFQYILTDLAGVETWLEKSFPDGRQLVIKNIVLPRSIGRVDGRFDVITITDNVVSDRVPKEIGNLKQLTELNIINIAAKTLPDEMGQMTNLKRLKLADMDQLTTTPEPLGALSMLENLYFSKLPKVTVIRRVPSNVRHLDIEYVPINALPTSSFRLLTSLRVSNTNLSSLPNQFFTHLAKNLETLVFIACPLTSLPENIKFASRLKRLYIKNMPSFIRLPKYVNASLDTLVVTGTGVSRVPIGITARKTRLTIMMLSDNPVNHPPVTLVPTTIIEPEWSNYVRSHIQRKFKDIGVATDASGNYLMYTMLVSRKEFLYTKYKSFLRWNNIISDAAADAYFAESVLSAVQTYFEEQEHKEMMSAYTDIDELENLISEMEDVMYPDPSIIQDEQIRIEYLGVVEQIENSPLSNRLDIQYHEGLYPFYTDTKTQDIIAKLEKILDLSNEIPHHQY